MRSCLAWRALLAGMLLTAACAGQQAGLDLAAVRAAVGRPPADRHVSLRGRAEIASLAADFEAGLCASGEGWILLGPPLDELLHWSGDAVQATTPAGRLRDVVLGQRDALQLLRAVLTGAAFDARGPVGTTPLDERSLSLRLADGPLVGTLEVDPHTHLPVRLTLPLGPRALDVGFADRREHEGWNLPRRVSFSARGLEMSFTLDEVAFSLPGGAACAVPAAARVARPARFAPDVAPTLDVQRAGGGHLLVHPRLQGQDLGWFLLDSGAASVLVDDTVAASLDLRPFGTVRSAGAAGGFTLTWHEGCALQLGPLQLTLPALGATDLGGLSRALGRPVAGILGTDVFEHAVVVLEPDGAGVALHDPATWAPPPNTVWCPVQVSPGTSCWRPPSKAMPGASSWTQARTGA